MPSTVMRATEREPGMFGVSVHDAVIDVWSVSEESFTFQQVIAMCVAYVREDQYLRIYRLDGTCAVYQPQWIHPLIGQMLTIAAEADA